MLQSKAKTVVLAKQMYPNRNVYIINLEKWLNVDTQQKMYIL